MTTKKRSLADAADTAAARSSTSTEQDALLPEPAPAAPVTKPIRTTIDLSPVDHAKLRRWCNDAADRLGVSEIAKANVWRALLDELVTDRELSTRVLRAIRRGPVTK